MTCARGPLVTTWHCGSVGWWWPCSFRFAMMRRSTFQTTLTGKLYAPKPVHDESKAANQSLYCQFVDAYCRFDDRTRATSVREAQTEWRKIREDEGAVRKRIEQFASRASSATAKLGDWAVTVSKAAPQPTGDGGPPSSDRDKATRRLVDVAATFTDTCTA